MVQHWDSETVRATVQQRVPCLEQQKEPVSALYSDPPLETATVQYLDSETERSTAQQRVPSLEQQKAPV